MNLLNGLELTNAGHSLRDGDTVRDHSARRGDHIRPKFNGDFVTLEFIEFSVGSNGRELQKLVEGVVQTGGFEVVKEVGGHLWKVYALKLTRRYGAQRNCGHVDRLVWRLLSK